MSSHAAQLDAHHDLHPSWPAVASSEHGDYVLVDTGAEEFDNWVLVPAPGHAPSAPDQELQGSTKSHANPARASNKDPAHATMVFLGIYRAVFDYEPRSNNELAITEGDLLFVLEKSTEDDWWKAKKKAENEDDDEPEGLIPNNYVEEVSFMIRQRGRAFRFGRAGLVGYCEGRSTDGWQATPIAQARALYDYSRQTDEELSFPEDATLDVYDTSDPDWTLVGLGGEYGFAPANYIEASGAGSSEPAPPAMPARPRIPEPEPADEPPTPSSIGTPTQSPAVALAGLLAQKTGPSAAVARAPAPISPPPATRPPRPQQFTPEDSEGEAPPMPRRPPSEQTSPRPTQTSFARPPSPGGIQSSLPYNRAVAGGYDEDSALQSPGGFHMYNIHEMIEHNGRNRKMPVTLGLNIAKGVIMIAPEKSRDGPQKEWTAEKLTHYSLEGKHVFMELVRPSRSIDFHAGAKDTAQEIVSSLGEIAGAAKAEGLREVLEAGQGGSGQKKGTMLYEFMAQGDDEVTVAVGDDVIVLDDQKSDEWWMVKRLKNGKEGVVPSSYVEITGVTSISSTTAGGSSRKSTVEQNRLDEERQTRHALKASKRDEDTRSAEVGPGLHLPKRMSSLLLGGAETGSSQRSKRDSRAASGQSSSGKTSESVVRLLRVIS